MWGTFYDPILKFDESKIKRVPSGHTGGGRFAPKDAGARVLDGRFENLDRSRREDDVSASQYASWEAAAGAAGFGKLNGALLANALRVLHVGPKLKKLVMQRAKEIHDTLTGGNQEHTSFATFARLKAELPFILNLKVASLAGVGMVFRAEWMQNERAWNAYASALRLSKAWDETKHPRHPEGQTNGGQFTAAHGGDGIPESAKQYAGWESGLPSRRKGRGVKR